jgi:hypothetical protein
MNQRASRRATRGELRRRLSSIPSIAVTPATRLGVRLPG